MFDVPDLSHPDAFADGFPHELFRRLRREAPVHWHDGDYLGGPGYWIVSRYETIKEISRQPELFSSAAGTSVEDRAGDFVSMIGMDPPDHRRYRSLVSGGFTPRRIAAREPQHREIVRSILDSVVDRGHCDFVVDVAAELPLRAIAELLGVPQSACRELFDWSNRMIGSQDEEYQTTEGEAEKAAQEMFVYANRLAEERLAEPRDDLISAILHGEVAGSRLGVVEFDSFFLLLAVAGNETTRNLISHGLLLLLEHPDAMARLREEPRLLPGAIEEMLRFRSPVLYMRRTASRDTELLGQRIRKGEKLLLYYPSANRDEAVFERPDLFDIEREENHHLAFGVGEHFCIGTHLARLEARVMFEGILARMHDIELAGPVSTLRSNLIDGIKHMPIRFDARPARRGGPGSRVGGPCAMDRDPGRPGPTAGRPTRGFRAAFDELHEIAARATGLSDFGDEAYRPSLELLLDCYDREAIFSDEGREATRRLLIGCLEGRLASTAGLARHPECLARRIERPLVIAGLPRTGSTALHRLLAADPDSQALEYWLGCRPDVRPPRDEWAEHPGYRAAVAALDRIYRGSPELRTAHSMRAGDADECRLLLMQDFQSTSFAFNATIPSYEAWVLEQDLRPAYARYRDNLKLIGSREPERRWVLKNSSHLWALPALEATFPDVCLVQTHRSPLEWIASSASLVHKSRLPYEPDVRKEDVGEQALRQWSKVIERSRADRERLGCRVLDLHYRHFVRDPLGTVRRIYEHFDWRWSSRVENAIREASRRDARDPDGVHRYSAEEYGLGRERIAERFADYIEWEQAILRST